MNEETENKCPDPNKAERSGQPYETPVLEALGPVRALVQDGLHLGPHGGGLLDCSFSCAEPV